jgi:16S rRNA (cytosine967-C5)-methyltransferase
MNVRARAVSLLLSLEEREGFANLALSDAVLAEAGKDAPLLTALFYGAVERRLTLDYAASVLSERGVESLSPHTRALLHLGLYQLYFMRIPAHAAVSETVSLAKNKGETALVNAVLRRGAREPMPLPPVGRIARYLSVKESFPLPTVRRFLSLFGEEETAALLAAFNTPHPLSLTVDVTRVSVETLCERFTAAGISWERGRYSPLTVKVTSAIPPTALPGFEEGLFLVQDEASAIAALALAPRVGDKIIDVCAAPGGKSMTAAILAKKQSDSYAFDLRESKLSLIEESARRLSVPLKVATLDATVGDDTLDGTADRVICDVPCSGLGVLSKKPDLRYRPLSEELAPLGYEILCRTSRYLKKGGVMVYSTCTLLPEENMENVNRFLAEHRDFETADFSVGGLASEGGALTLLPQKHGTDGFFVCKLKRK